MSDTTGSAVRTSSEHLFERASELLAGGISHEGRYTAPYPIYIDRALGSRKWDVDGNEYVDFSMGSASLLLGHGHPDVVKALQDQATRGTFYANCHPLEVEWAQLIQAMMPSSERVRFVGSGTEATMLALRLARASTGRTKVIRFEGHYHGWHDFLALGMSAPYDVVPSLGVLPASAASTLVCKPDADDVEAMLEQQSDVAAIICEVSGASWGSVPIPLTLLGDLRRLADRYGVVLIFDEVITGFRWSPGGMQALAGVRPDLTTFAKIVTGGLPGGAVGGRESIMRLLDPRVTVGGRRPGVAHKGTFNGNPLVAAGAVAALKVVKTGAPQRHADAIAQRLRQGMQTIMEGQQVNGVVYGTLSTFQVYFGGTTVDGLSAAQIRGVPKETVAGFQRGLRERGVDLMSYMGGVTSLAHTGADVDFMLGAFEETVRDLVAAKRVTRI